MLKFYKSTAGCGWDEHIDVVQFPNGKFLECGAWTNDDGRNRVTTYDYSNEMYYLTRVSREEFLSTSVVGEEELTLLEELVSREYETSLIKQLVDHIKDITCKHESVQECSLWTICNHCGVEWMGDDYDHDSTFPTCYNDALAYLKQSSKKEESK